MEFETDLCLFLLIKAALKTIAHQDGAEVVDLPLSYLVLV